MYLAVWAGGKHILTVEGLRDKNNGELSIVQKTFVEKAVAQTGTHRISGLLQQSPYQIQGNTDLITVLGRKCYNSLIINRW